MNPNSIYDPAEEHDACGVGFVARLDGEPRRQVVTDALTAMARLAHRGGHSADGKSGDGAGLLVPLPRPFFANCWPGLDRKDARWAVGQIFLPRDAALRDGLMRILGDSLRLCGLEMLDGRDVPVCPEACGDAARATMPNMVQIAVRRAASAEALDGDGLERLLYVARRRMEKAAAAYLRERGRDEREFTAVTLSARAIVYKGMLPGARLAELYPDLSAEAFTAPFAVFHERFSTNTLPAWRLAQPFRMLAHNGEINTLRGNTVQQAVREPLMESALFGRDMAAVLPVIDVNGSDSAKLDNMLEALVHGGRSLQHALMMLVPEPFGAAFVMGDNKRAFYEYHSCLMEPWDGPTALVFTDGRSRVGAMLDRNGLRPCRFGVSRDGVMTLASETGVRDGEPNSLRECGQLAPRRMIIADIERHRIVRDAEIKGQVIRRHPYRRWLNQNAVLLGDLPDDDDVLESAGLPDAAAEPPRDAAARERLFGWGAQVVRERLLPMCRDGQEAVGAMGDDMPLAVLDARPRSLFDYFKQQFAQVTNPPIDPLREELSLSLMSHLGRQRNILEPSPKNCALLRLQHPFLSRGDMRRLRGTRNPAVLTRTLDATFPAADGPAGEALEKALDALFSAAEKALAAGATLLVLSDAAAYAQADRLPIPALLAASGLHQHLIAQKKRHLCSIIVESGEAYAPAHMAELLAFGANAVCPYAALDAVRDIALAGTAGETTPHKACAAYVAALKKGLLKSMARLGISTLRSFHAGQYYEAVGIAAPVAERYFGGVASRVGGVGLGAIAAEVRMRASGAAAKKPLRLWNRESVGALRRAAQKGDAQAFAEFAAANDAASVTLRSCFRFVPDAATPPVPLEEVEPASDIVKRFVGAAMSFGAISREAHETIAAACNALGARSNCGEGGEDPARGPAADGRDVRSRVRQLASGRFGVTAEYLREADEVQIKMAQGAKPGEGGHLPGRKVTDEIARVRGTMPGVSLVSPPPHHDIYSIEDLAQLIFDLDSLHPGVRVSVKLAAEKGIGTVAVGVAKAGAHGITVSGHDGGTGAAPLSAIEHAGMPWELGLAETHRALCANGLRHTVRVQVDGHLHTGRDLAVAALLGADEFGFGTPLLVSLGCVMCRQCHKGRCAAGISTQDKALRARFAGRVEDVVHFFLLLAEDLRRHMASLGYRRVRDMIGQAHRLAWDAERAARDTDALRAAKTAGMDLGGLFVTADAPRGRFCPGMQASARPDTPLERLLHAQCGVRKAAGRANGNVVNTDRAVGSRLAGEWAALRHAEGRGVRPDVRICLHGSAGQSFGAFLLDGMTLDLKGDANDYFGKGLCGGVLTAAPEKLPAVPLTEPPSVVGNVALYGATGGEAYICGAAGERFAVRNSGAVAVVEGVGDHACEYMTGGTVVVLGHCGYNFAAGMSGGTAYAYDADERFQNRCNTDSVDLESVWRPEDCAELKSILQAHVRHTGSPMAQSLLDHWDAALPLFVKVMPLDYREALERQRGAERHAGDTTSATEEVFAEDAAKQ